MAAAETGTSRKLYGYALSSNSVRIAALLNEKGLHYDLVAVDLDNKTPEFLAISPFGQIPAFQDGDDVLFESRAISRHIATKYKDLGPDLLPTPSAKLETWLEVESHHFYPAVADLVYEIRVRPRLPGGVPPDPDVVDGLARKVADVLDVYEAHLAGTGISRGTSSPSPTSTTWRSCWPLARRLGRRSSSPPGRTCRHGGRTSPPAPPGRRPSPRSPFHRRE